MGSDGSWEMPGWAVETLSRRGQDEGKQRPWSDRRQRQSILHIWKWGKTRSERRDRRRGRHNASAPSDRVTPNLILFLPHRPPSPMTNKNRHVPDPGCDRDLAEEVEPAGDPRHERGLLRLGQHGGPEVRPTARRVCTANFCEVRVSTAFVHTSLEATYLPCRVRPSS